MQKREQSGQEYDEIYVRKVHFTWHVTICKDRFMQRVASVLPPLSEPFPAELVMSASLGCPWTTGLR